MVSELINDFLELAAWVQGYAAAVHAYFTTIVGGSSLAAAGILAGLFGFLTYQGRNLPLKLWHFLKRHAIYTYVIEYDRYMSSDLIHSIAQVFEQKLQEHVSHTRGTSRITTLRNRLVESLSDGGFFYWHNGVLMRITRKQDAASGGGKDSSLRSMVSINITTLKHQRQVVMEMLNETASDYTTPGIYQLKAPAYSSIPGTAERRRTHSKLANLVIDPEIKKEVDDALQKFLETRKKRLSEGLPCKLTLLFYGEPGTGKSALAEYIAFVMKTSLFMYNGDTCSNRGQLSIREAVNIARENVSQDEVPVILVDDVDAVFPQIRCRKQKLLEYRKNLRSSSSHGFEAPTGQSSELGIVLGDLQSPVEITNCVVVFTTNYLENIDAAVYRPGRMTKVLRVDRMKPEAIMQFFEITYGQSWPRTIHLDKKLRACDVDDYANKYVNDPNGFVFAVINHTAGSDEKFMQEMAALRKEISDEAELLKTTGKVSEIAGDVPAPY